MKNIGLYIHIPFCKSKCAYCNFTSFRCEEGKRQRYIEALKREIEAVLDKDYVIDTMYIGGGTPSLLRGEDIRDIVDKVKECATFIPRECTIECNPESVDEEKLAIYKACGITRISMGVQSLSDEVLKIIGRIHTASDAIDKAKLVKEYGFDLSVDMILGLPHSIIEDIRRFIDTFSKIGAEHISAYSLSVEDGTILDKKVKSHEIVLPSEDYQIDEYNFAHQYLKLKGYERYEVSNFAKPHHESIHNTKYWTMEEYVGVGIASHSFVDGKRYYNTSDIDEYLTLINDGKRPSTIDEVLTLRDRVEETVMLGLRTERGVSIDVLDSLIGDSFLARNKTNIDKVKDYINIKDGYLAIKPEYMNVMNTIIVDLLEG